MSIIITIIQYNQQETISHRLPELPNYNIKYIKDNYGRCYIPKKFVGTDEKTGNNYFNYGWKRVDEDEAIDRTPPLNN